MIRTVFSAFVGSKLNTTAPYAAGKEIENSQQKLGANLLSSLRDTLFFFSIWVSGCRRMSAFAAAPHMPLLDLAENTVYIFPTPCRDLELNFLNLSWCVVSMESRHIRDTSQVSPSRSRFLIMSLLAICFPSFPHALIACNLLWYLTGAWAEFLWVTCKE